MGEHCGIGWAGLPGSLAATLMLDPLLADALAFFCNRRAHRAERHALHYLHVHANVAWGLRCDLRNDRCVSQAQPLNLGTGPCYPEPLNHVGRLVGVIPPGATHQIHLLLEAGDGFVSLNKKLFFSLIIRPDEI